MAAARRGAIAGRERRAAGRHGCARRFDDVGDADASAAGMGGSQIVGSGDRHRAPEEAGQLIEGDAGRPSRARLSRRHAERQGRHGGSEDQGTHVTLLAG